MNFIIFVTSISRKLVNSGNNFCITHLIKLPSYIFPFSSCLLSILLHVVIYRALAKKRYFIKYNNGIIVYNGSQYKIQTERYL